MDENPWVEAGRVEPDIQSRISRIVWEFCVLRKKMARVIAENYLRLVVLCVPVIVPPEMKRTPRARANALREYLTHSEKDNKFDHEELYKVFELCVSCKACASECPSNVYSSNEIGVLYQYQKQMGFHGAIKCLL
jgi:ferredoxin